ncbi:MAG: mechanosensitive ion channel [Coprococcus sp.]|nr:mechanosensitive ion channel [Coprococcus sp.]
MILWEADAKAADNAASEAAEQIGIIKEYVNKILDWFMSKLGSLAIAVIFMVICFKLVKLLIKFLRKTFDKTNLDVSVAGFFLSAIRILLNFLIVLTAASIVGFQITSFITLLGTAGVTLGLALQGSLSNLAGGVLILILKPFHIGDYIIENNTNCEGTVVSIDIFYTKLVTVDNKSIVIPNGNISNTSLINVTEREKRRVDIAFSVSYDSDLDKVKQVVLDIVKKLDGFRENDAVDFFIDNFGQSGLEMCVRFFVDIDKFFPAKWETMWNIKKAFDENGIEIPYSKMDVNILEQKQ